MQKSNQLGERLEGVLLIHVRACGNAVNNELAQFFAKRLIWWELLSDPIYGQTNPNGLIGPIRNDVLIGVSGGCPAANSQWAKRIWGVHMPELYVLIPLGRNCVYSQIKKSRFAAGLFFCFAVNDAGHPNLKFYARVISN